MCNIILQKATKTTLTIFVIFISLVVSLVICEFFIRIFIPQTTYSGGLDFFDTEIFDLKPNYQGTFSHPDYKYSFKTNNDRLRFTKNFDSDSGNLFSVLILGDSFAFGMGVNDSETLASVISINLHSQHIPAYIYNASVPAYTAAEEVCKYHRVKNIVKPDIVIIVLCFNDFVATTMPCDSMIPRNYQNKSKHKQYLWKFLYPYIRDILLENSQLAVFFADRFNQILISMGIRDSFKRVMAPFDQTVYKIEIERTNHLVEVLYQLQLETNTDSIPLVFAYVPSLLEVNDGLWHAVNKKSSITNRKLAHDHIVNAAKQAGIVHIIDPIASEEGKQSLQGSYFPLEMHLNKNGHAYFGTLIADQIIAIINK
jgi:hypothetical protein